MFVQGHSHAADCLGAAACMYMHMFLHMCETADARNPVMAQRCTAVDSGPQASVADHPLGTLLTACNDIQRGVGAATGPRGTVAMFSTVAEAGWGPQELRVRNGWLAIIAPAWVFEARGYEFAYPSGGCI